MPGERVAVRLGAGPMVAPRRAAVLTSHHASQLDADEEEVRVGARRDPAHVRGPGRGGKLQVGAEGISRRLVSSVHSRRDRG